LAWRRCRGALAVFIDIRGGKNTIQAMKQAKKCLAAARRDVTVKTSQAAPAEDSAPLQFSIATSWDDALLEHLVVLQHEHHRACFTEVYGAHRTSLVGHGRPAYRLPEVDREVFERHVGRALELGLRFNYVMNAPDFDGREKSVEWLREVSAWLAYLARCGVSGVTISHRDLLQFVKREFPNFRINVSVIAGVETVAEARKFEDMGVDVINLNPFTINRDFDSLRAIRQAVRCELELYANIACLDRCPRRDVHYQYSGRASQAASAAEITQDPFLMHCSHTFLSNPVEFLRSPFIRPEDISAYRQAGMDIFKISDRTEATAFLLQTARAYAAGRYDGNLFDLIFRSGRKIRAGLGWVRPGAPVQAIPIVIRNSVLNEIGFIEQIKKLRGAELAEFYRMAAARAVTCTNPQAIDEWRRVLQERVAA
jgi:collagenase-like PrtC family protease